ncbi:Cu(I)-responsive transcriptional regulator [Rhodoligotrophos defluvii]|uniref:Cu(I)-responsive transcriptional regulator n=1 Tax=Rhodoligotrophos defluvii TaxID=2561934 RepID=UPI0010C9BBE4|nr:Cu(I)-responsive transcriptional regulator [Rhodoligotrophos defluvii]
MNISQAARASGLPAKTLRYYEDIGLVRPRRRDNGYRVYGPQEVARLRFLQRARALGFSIDDCRMLASLQEDHGRRSAEVRAIAEHHVEEIDRRIEHLREMRRELNELIAACPGNEQQDCAILDRLAGAEQLQSAL